MQMSDAEKAVRVGSAVCESTRVRREGAREIVNVKMHSFSEHDGNIACLCVFGSLYS